MKTTMARKRRSERIDDNAGGNEKRKALNEQDDPTEASEAEGEDACQLPKLAKASEIATESETRSDGEVFMPLSQQSENLSEVSDCTGTSLTESALGSLQKVAPLGPRECGPPDKTVNIAVASRALFKWGMPKDIAQQVEEKDFEEFIEYHVAHEEIPLEQGSAFPFIQALDHVNACLRAIDVTDVELFNVILMSHNHAQTGVRLIKSLNHYNLHIERLCMTGGTNPVDYLKAYNVSLFLTSFPDEVEQALEEGFAAAGIFDQKIENPIQEQLRVAFDLDSVIFSDESEKIFNEQGFDAYRQNEMSKADQPISDGPMRNFASAIGRMQKKFRQHRDLFPEPPLRTYIVTARSAASSGERAVKTLRAWGLDIDELHFLAGASKGPVLKAIKPHIFFDDSHMNVEKAQEVGTPAAHVKHRGKAPMPMHMIPAKEKPSFVRKLSMASTGEGH